MTYHLLFWMMCAVLAAHVTVAVISIVKAYRDEGKLFGSRPAFFLERGKRTVLL